MCIIPLLSEKESLSNNHIQYKLLLIYSFVEINQFHNISTIPSTHCTIDQHLREVLCTLWEEQHHNKTKRHHLLSFTQQ